MQIVTAERMRALDRRAMDEGGMPGVVLMENAGRAVCEEIARRCGPARDRPFHVFCGVGNNGGDGFVVARYLKLAGAHVTVTLAGEAENLKGDARLHFDLMRRMGIAPVPLPAAIARDCMVVDALLGTGARGAPRGAVAEAIRLINMASGPVVAVDLPSGVDADTGATPGEAVCAAFTVTFAFPKPGMFLAPGADCVGDLLVRDIGFAWETLAPETPYRWIRPEAMRRLLPRRPPESHKGMFGHVLVVGGSAGMSGAPTMTALAAMRAGAGLVTVAAPESAQRLIAGKLNEAMTLPLPEQGGALCAASYEPLRALAERCDVLCLGPGASQSAQARDLMRRVMAQIQKPMVIDADGLNALAEFPETLTGRTAPTLLTPHPGECGRLLGSDAGAVQADRLAAARQAAARYGAVVVLKGRRTLICDGRRAAPPPPGEGEGREEDILPVGVNTTGNPGMATGGSGDSLTGILGALLGQGLDPFDAACAGVCLHGCAGDRAAAGRGEAALIAGDIIEALPRVLREWEEKA